MYKNYYIIGARIIGFDKELGVKGQTKLTDEQALFHIQNPNASITEVLQRQLKNPTDGILTMITFDNLQQTTINRITDLMTQVSELTQPYLLHYLDRHVAMQNDGMKYQQILQKRTESRLAILKLIDKVKQAKTIDEILEALLATKIYYVSENDNEEKLK